MSRYNLPGTVLTAGKQKWGEKKKRPHPQGTNNLLEKKNGLICIHVDIYFKIKDVRKENSVVSTPQGKVVNFCFALFCHAVLTVYPPPPENQSLLGILNRSTIIIIRILRSQKFLFLAFVLMWSRISLSCFTGDYKPADTGPSPPVDTLQPHRLAHLQTLENVIIYPPGTAASVRGGPLGSFPSWNSVSFL